MEMTLVKSLHSGDPACVIQTCGLANARFLGASLVSAIWAKASHAYGDPTFDLTLLAECMSAKHLGTGQPSGGSKWQKHKLFEWLLSRVLASHRGGLSLIPGQDMSVLGPLV